MLPLAVALVVLGGGDLKFLEKLPNVKFDGDMYAYSGDSDAMMLAVNDALAEHGWALGATIMVGAAKAASAFKGREKLFIIMGPKGFFVKREAHDGGMPTVGPSIGIFEKNAKKTLDCTGKAVGVRSTGGDLTLQGRCGQLSVTGSGNKVKVLGSVEAVLLMGADNEVTLPSGAAPQVANFGTNNRVKP